MPIETPSPVAYLSNDLDGHLSAICHAGAFAAISRRTPATMDEVEAALADVEAVTMPLVRQLQMLATWPSPPPDQIEDEADEETEIKSGRHTQAVADRGLRRSARRYKARKRAEADRADAAAQINDYLNGETD